MPPSAFLGATCYLDGSGSPLQNVPHPQRTLAPVSWDPTVMGGGRLFQVDLAVRLCGPDPLTNT